MGVVIAVFWFNLLFELLDLRLLMILLVVLDCLSFAVLH